MWIRKSTLMMNTFSNLIPLAIVRQDFASACHKAVYGTGVICVKIQHINIVGFAFHLTQITNLLKSAIYVISLDLWACRFQKK